MCELRNQLLGFIIGELVVLNITSIAEFHNKSGFVRLYMKQIDMLRYSLYLGNLMPKKENPIHNCLIFHLSLHPNFSY